MSANQRIDYEKQLARDIGECVHDPLKYALYNWPKLDLRQWQVEHFQSIAKRLKENPCQPIQEAIASGHGIGKGCDGTILAHWALSTREMTRGVITANTEHQLRKKTWPELAKWHSLARNSHWFICTATSLYHPDFPTNWCIDAVPWSEHNTEAFAGLHNKGPDGQIYRIFILFDEASSIHDEVWRVTEGALTDENTEIIWLANGNPTRTTGRFKDCFGRSAHRWGHRNIDSRTVEGTNKIYLQKLVDDNGEDSDVVRVRVRGVFPRASVLQLIDNDLVSAAMKREPYPNLREPLIMSIDVSRGGNDNFVIAYRRGLDARSVPWVVIPGSETRDSEKVLAKVVDLATTSNTHERPDAVFVDETGLGGPIVDRLTRLLGDAMPVHGVQFGGASPDPKLADMRTYIWVKLRDSLRVGLCIPDDSALEMELTGPEYDHDKRDKLRLESKENMKDRLPEVGSPDRGDALAISFAYNVQPRDHTQIMGSNARAKTDYDWLERP